MVREWRSIRPTSENRGWGRGTISCIDITAHTISWAPTISCIYTVYLPSSLCFYTILYIVYLYLKSRICPQNIVSQPVFCVSPYNLALLISTTIYRATVLLHTSPHIINHYILYYLSYYYLLYILYLVLLCILSPAPLRPSYILYMRICIPLYLVILYLVPISTYYTISCTTIYRTLSPIPPNILPYCIL